MIEKLWLFHLISRKEEISQQDNRDASTRSHIWFIRPRNASWNSRTTGPKTSWLDDKRKPSTDSNGLEIEMLHTPLPYIELILSETAADTQMWYFCQLLETWDQFVLLRTFKAILAANKMLKMASNCLPNIIFPFELHWVLSRGFESPVT